jgi:FkbH-like protein
MLRTIGAVKPGSSWSEYHAAARALDGVPAGEIPDTLRARIAVLGSFTLDPFISFLRVEGARAGLWIDCYLAGYGQYVQELLSSDSQLYRFQPHVTFIAIDGDVLWNQRWSENPPRRNEPVVGELLGPLFAGLDAFEQQGSGILVVNDFALPRASTEGVNAFRTKTTFAHLVAHANKHLRLRLASRDHSFLFPLADVVAQIGRTQAFNWRTHYRGHVTWSDSLMSAVARRYVGFAQAALGHAVKCIVLDLDNTLWGGVLGEDGPAGIALGPEWPGREFLDLQRELLDLERQGVLLTICSKNNEEEALQVLREHPHMLIREEHLAAHRINWRDKAANIRELAAELNLGIDHMLLIDDSAHEREWVRRQLPEMHVPELPSDPSFYADWVASLPSVIVLHQTAEDILRTSQYQQHRHREQYRQRVGSMEDFLRGLELRVQIAEVDDATMSRVVQLLAKTNQFNLTTRRHDEASIRRQVTAGAWRVYTMRVSDRFGDFGLTGVAIAVPGPKVWHLDSFLLSCRVIGKSVESALLAAVARDARRSGAESLTAEYLDSGRNRVAADFLANHGFVAEPEGQFRRSLTDQGPAWPEWIAAGPSSGKASAA